MAKINKKIFWKNMEAWEQRETFLNELRKNYLLGEDVRIRFSTKTYIIGAEILDPNNEDLSLNALAPRSLYNAVGETLFFSYIKEFSGQTIKLSVPQLRNIEIFLDLKHGASNTELAAKYHLSKSRVSHICKDIEKLVD